MAIFVCIWYCFCRVIVMSLMQFNNGGNAEPPTRTAIILPDKFYEATRSYIDIESFGVEAPIYFTALI